MNAVPLEMFSQWVKDREGRLVKGTRTDGCKAKSKDPPEPDITNQWQYLLQTGR